MQMLPMPSRHPGILAVLALVGFCVALSNTAAAQPTLSVSGGSATEGASVVFTVRLSAESNQTVAVRYATSSGTATSGTDFTAASGTLAFPPGEITDTVSVQTTEDTADEEDETFTLTLSNPTNATLGTDTTATGTINEPDEDSPPLVSVSGGNSATEGSSVEFTVTLSKASDSQVSVGFTPHQASGDTATRDDDFSWLSGSLVLAPGATSGTISVTTTDDVLDEDNETFTVTLTSATNASLSSRKSAGGTILDNDDPPTVSVSNASAAEGSPVDFTVSLSVESGRQVTVAYATSSGTATSGTDFTAASGTLTFAAGTISETVSVSTTEDTTDEEKETFTLTLSDPTNATLGNATATGAINDDNRAATVSVSGGNADEGEAVAFTVTLSVERPDEVTVAYATSSGTATSGTDFTAASGTLTFAARTKSQTVSVRTKEDTTDEENEVFTLTLSNPKNATLGANPSATGTILDNDDPPTVSVSNASAAEGSPVDFTVSLSVESGRQVTVAYATSSGTATSGTDFTAASGTLTFAAGTISETVSVSTTEDTTDEEKETFTLTLSDPTNATLGNATATGAILSGAPMPKSAEAVQAAVNDAIATATNGEGLNTRGVSVAVPLDELFSFSPSAASGVTYGGTTFSVSSTAPSVVSVSTTDDGPGGPGVVLTPGADSGTATVTVDARPSTSGGPLAAVASVMFDVEVHPAEDTAAPTVTITSTASAPVSGPFSITVTFSELVSGFRLSDLVVGNGTASELRGTEATYTATITPVVSGVVTVDIAAAAAQDGAGNPSVAANQFSIAAVLAPVPALPVVGAMALAVLLLVVGIRRCVAATD